MIFTATTILFAGKDSFPLQTGQTQKTALEYWNSWKTHYKLQSTKNWHKNKETKYCQNYICLSKLRQDTVKIHKISDTALVEFTYGLTMGPVNRL